jgi:hypothetical protein
VYSLRGGRDSNARTEARSGTKTDRFDTDGEGTIGADRAPACATVPADGRFRTNGEGAERISDGDERFELGDVVEPALARALVLAAGAGRWDVVEQIAAELRIRRESRDGHVEANGPRPARKVFRRFPR